jgi:peroxiredoxin
MHVRGFTILFTIASVLVASGCETGSTVDKPVYSSPEEVKPLGKGDMAPDGVLSTVAGKEVGLRLLLSAKPTVLIFYRGGWCPFCNVQMGQLVVIEPGLEKMGYQILAITPDKPESLRSSISRHEINYTLLSDRSMNVTRQFGLAYYVDTAMLDTLRKYGHDLELSTGNSIHELPVPAAYVIDTKSIIHYAYYNPDFKVRVNTDDLMKAAAAAR